METFYLQALMHILQFYCNLHVHFISCNPGFWRFSMANISFYPHGGFLWGSVRSKRRNYNEIILDKITFHAKLRRKLKDSQLKPVCFSCDFFSFYAISNFIEDNLIISPSRSRGAPDRPDGQFSPFNIFWINENGLNPMIICI